MTFFVILDLETKGILKGRRKFYYACLRRSSRRQDWRLTLDLSRAVWGSSASLVLEMCLPPTIPPPGAVPRTQPWETNMVLRPSGWLMWLNLVKMDFKILVGRCRDLLLSQTQMYIPCLLNLPPTNRMVVSFFRPLAFCVRSLVSDVTPGTPSAVNWWGFKTSKTDFIL